MRAWHGSLGADGLVAITPLAARTGGATNSLFGRSANVARGAETLGLDDWIWQTGKTGPHNLYHCVGLLKARPKKGRGKKEDVAWEPGLWMDLDVGGDKFADEAACWEALRACSRAGMSPSIIVASGSGGLHGYWLVEGGVDGGVAEIMNRRLRMWIERETGAVVDNVSSREHIMRLPGSVRWPKSHETGVAPTLVTIPWMDPSGRRLDLDRLRDLTEEMWTAEVEAHAARRAAFHMENAEAMDVLISGRCENEWDRLYRVAFLEQIFAEHWSWEEVLEPHGWTLITDWSGLANGAPDADGRRTWTRPGVATAGKPGVNARSLQTDWVEAPDYATLKSKNPDTGLMRLVDAGVPLSKFRVWLELSEKWRGDLVGYMREVVAGTATELW